MPGHIYMVCMGDNSIGGRSNSDALPKNEVDGYRAGGEAPNPEAGD